MLVATLKRLPVNCLLLLCSALIVWCWQGCSWRKDKPQAVAKASGRHTIVAAPQPAVNTAARPEELYQPLSFKLHQPLTARTCVIYAEGDTASAKLVRVPAGAPLIVYGTRKVGNTVTIRLPGGADSALVDNQNFFYVKYGSRKGFLRFEDVLPFTLTDTARAIRYAIGHRFTPDSSSYQMHLQKTDLYGKRQLASADIDEEFDGNFNVQLITAPRLKHVPVIVKISNYDEFCGGSDRTHYLADAGTRLVKLPLDIVMMDDGGGVESDLVFLPVMHADSSYLLLHDTIGQPGSLADTLTFPAALSYPPNQIFATQHTSGQYAMNASGDYIKTKDGYFKMRFPIIATTRFYHWNGQRFTLLPQKVVARAKPEKWKE